MRLSRWVLGRFYEVLRLGKELSRARRERQDLLIPASLLAEACLFFAWMCFSNCGLEEARARGLLFPAPGLGLDVFAYAYKISSPFKCISIYCILYKSI